jgi:hypothetical protein
MNSITTHWVYLQGIVGKEFEHGAIAFELQNGLELNFTR